jgi:hypothetical protein
MRRCLEEMGNWDALLQVIDQENAEAAAAPDQALSDGGGDDVMEDAELAAPDDARLFLRTDSWDGPHFLRWGFL